VFIIVWAVVMGSAWIYLGGGAEDLFIMGTRPWDSPREQCLVIAWGYETQHKLMWTKVAFLAFGYVFTFLGSILFSIRQLRIYQRMDLNNTTHKDFCAVASGLSGISGEERIEEELKEFFEKQTGRTVIGVSISWVFEHCEDEIMGILDEDLVLLQVLAEKSKTTKTVSQDAVREDLEAVGMDEDYKDRRVSQASDGTVEDDPLETSRSEKAQPFSKELTELHNESTKTKLMRSIESVFLSTHVQKALTRGRARGFEMRHRCREADGHDAASKDKHGEEHNNQVKQMLFGLKSSGKVFVVFDTERDRNAAIAESSSQDMTFRDKPVRLDAVEVEPEGALWQNFADENVPFGHKAKVAAGVVSISFALCIWAGVFYLPFVWVSASASYSYGQSPDGVSQFVFGMIVVLGNVMMYSTCSEVSDRMRFTYRKDREVCYMIFYTISCMFNVLLDLVITCFMAYWQLSGLGARMYGGQPITEAPTVISLLMTYGMQRELGENTQAYAWPSTFLIPFLLEPFAAVFLPYMIMVLLVRSHSDIRTAASEAYLASIPFDLSRYADIHLNVILAVLILFFPGGHNLIIFFGLAIGHLWIYAYDHVRVLRFCPSFTYASADVDWWAQWMLAFPCALLLSALMWKSNQDMEFEMTKAVFGKMGDPQESSIGILVMLVAAFCGHRMVAHVGAGDSCAHVRDQAGKRGPRGYVQGLCAAAAMLLVHIESHPLPQVGLRLRARTADHVLPAGQGAPHGQERESRRGQYFEDKIAQPEDVEGWTPSNVFESMGLTRRFSITGLSKDVVKETGSPPDSPTSSQRMGRRATVA
ncbi:unnamed protein product, partial [Prorocentrum cordatum]